MNKIPEMTHPYGKHWHQPRDIRKVPMDATHKPHIGWIVPGLRVSWDNDGSLRVSWDNDGRLRRSTIEEEQAIWSLISLAAIVEVKVPVASDPNSGKIGLKLDEVKITDPKKAEYEEFVRNNLKQIASMFGLPYSVLAANMSRAATAFTEFRARGEGDCLDPRLSEGG